MKKLFTLSIAIFCALAVNAQMTESGNGFVETFSYPDGTVYEDVAYEGIGAEWPDSSVIADGMLSWYLPDSSEAAMGLWELSMDLTENTDIHFKYKFPAGGEFGIWVEDALGGGGELFPEDLMLGLEDLMSYTLDLTHVNFADVDLSQVTEVWIMSYIEAASTFYLDDLVIGDGFYTGLSSKEFKSNLQVYPNPAAGEFRIDTDIESLAIYNSIGQVVKSVENYRKDSPIDISTLGEGMYIIKADENTHKLMVE